ncbi:YHYH protein [Shewanella salipaludis]|uniref:YHYH protein n=1 Tax=Shewanella salipaludis TaxID=2723052 RepID=A0A972G2J9_9GAMM|nr:YHYH protein [Shewanella salipaludis]NMH66331.1 YHYH protein [Shewanella salipaludis]
MSRKLLFPLLVAAVLTACGGGDGAGDSTQDNGSGAGTGGTGTGGTGGTGGGTGTGSSDSPTLTQGPASVELANLFSAGSRVAALGRSFDGDGTSWLVPAEVRYQDNTVPMASDLYNAYVSGHSYADSAAAVAALDANGSDIVEIDADGEVISAFIFADNYFELYVNGIAIAKDPVPFTEFNSNIVRFRVKQPFTVAMHLVDWEENLGTGTENNQGSSFHPGDGGMVALFKDAGGNIIGKTDSSWKAQTFYTAPITDTACLSQSAGLRASSSCATTAPSDIATVYAAHWAVPENWAASDFDDSLWPNAYSYSNTTVGVDNKPAYTQFTDLFDNSASDAQFIWSSNLILDNQVLVRAIIGSSGSGTGTGSGSSGDFFLSSQALKSKLIMPLSATCEGADNGKMLPLSWENAPEGTQSFALAMYTFPNPSDTDFAGAHYYQIQYDIPAATTALSEGDHGTGLYGINSVNGQQSYSAPCSQGAAEHTYILSLYALSAPVGSLGLTAASTDLVALENAIADKVLGSSSLHMTRVRYNPNNDEHVPTSTPSDCATKSAAFEDYAGLVSVSCDSSTMTVNTLVGLPDRSQLDVDKANVGTHSWIGRVPLPQQPSWSVPLAPQYLASTGSNLNIHHPIGIAVDGVPILHYAKENSPDEVAQLGQDYSSRDTVLLGEVDQCGAHAGNGEDYHYHYAPLCLMDTQDPSKPLAYMFDGIPLYFGTGGGQLTSGGVNYGGGRYTNLDYRPQKVKTGERPLDECNAYDLHGDGSEYVYYSSATAPYTIGCYRAEASQATAMQTVAAHWENERLQDFTFGTEVELTDYDTLSLNGATWTYIEVTPSADNSHIPAGNVAMILYRPLVSGESGYQAGKDCYRFRYRLDKNDSTGSDDLVTAHCR